MTEQSDQLQVMRHSLAHIMANAVQHLWPGAQFGVGPAVANGFYYDIDLGDTKISEEDFDKIEAEMHKIIAADQPFQQTMKSIDEAIAWAQQSNQPYKEELLNDLKRSGTTNFKDLDPKELGTIADGEAGVTEVSFYTNGDFTDLCRGPHVASTGQVGPFKLMRVAGAYWRGNEKNPQMQRLYGVAFNSEAELASYLQMLEEAKKRDHRKLGQELDLFVFSDLVGAGLPLFTPRGTVIRDALLGFSEELQRTAGYEKVFIPHITKQELYEKSGHWDKFGDELFLVKSQETSDQFVLKPMNCPHHIQIYASRPRSYRELPVRYMESTVQYRDEKKGELNGLSRVRSISIDDAHVFCSLDQIEAEFTTIMAMIRDMYSVFDMKFRARLSFRDDSEGYLGDPKDWEAAQATIEGVAKKLEVDYFIEEGEAAFYGPKIDIMVTDALGREWQCATEQLDFVQPARFGLTYTDAEGSEKQPVMVHKALLGSVERFLAVYIEHTAGRFPVWLAPEQIRLITVNQEPTTLDFAEKVRLQAKELGLRLMVDNSNESVGKKIRAAEVAKVPYTIVIGEKEIASGEVVPRIRSDMQVMEVSLTLGIEQFLKTVANENKSRVLKTSL
ncbi:MAG TPA: threonine--tRNA ligase [Candidatus Saccharimonadales bacterium]|jgi:threonyl-tRNA synthetase|nr:threonine--tRNA ligase [Candidatus Saccharimonadales bacterium]